MELLRRYGRYLARYHWLFIFAILLLTVFFGFYYGRFEQETSEDAFSPENEVARANTVVQEDFGGSRGQHVVVIDGDNILSLASMNALLDLEEKVLNDTVTSNKLASTPENPIGIGHPASLVAGAIFLARANEIFNGTNGKEGDRPDPDLMGKMRSLSVEEKRTVLNGGTIELSRSEIVLEFASYTPDILPGLLERGPFLQALKILLPYGYDANDISASGCLFVLYTDPDLAPEEVLEVDMALEDIGDKIEDRYDLKMTVVGEALLNEKINEALGRSQNRLFAIALAAVIVLLLVVFRSIFEVVVKLFALVFSVVWVFGAAGLLGMQYNPALTAVPVLVIALGIDYGIHLTLRYREGLNSGMDAGKALENAEGTVGFAIMLAALTTMVGFLSNIFSGSPAIRTFGVLNAIGISGAFVIMMTLIPSSRIIRDRWKEKREKDPSKNKSSLVDNLRERLGRKFQGTEEREDSTIKVFLGTGEWFSRKPWIVTAVSVLLLGAGLYSAFQLSPTYDFTDFLPEGLEISEATESLFTDFNFSGERTYILMEGSVADPEVVLAMEEAVERASTKETVLTSRKILSPVVLAKASSDPDSPFFNASIASVYRSNLDLNTDGRIDPDITKERVLSTYQALVEYGGEEAVRVLRRSEQGGFDGALVSIPVRSRGGELTERITEDIENASAPLEKLEDGPLKRVIVTGGPIVQQAVLRSISENQVRSVMIAFLVSLVLLSIIFILTRKSYFLGLITMLPLLLVIGWTLGSMNILGIPLNVVTVTITSIAVGLGIDYNVHITQRFAEELSRRDSCREAISVTVKETGKALLGSASTTIVGFVVISFSIIPPLSQFGMVTALAILFAFVSSVFILPSFLIIWARTNGCPEK